MKDIILTGGLKVLSNEVPVKVKLAPDVELPRYMTDAAAGFDLAANQDAVIMPGETALIDTGLAFELDAFYELQIRPRSGLSAKTAIRVANSPGTCDADFRGFVKVILHNTGATPFTVNKGDRIAQAVLVPVMRAVFQVVEELGETERGSGAFGSTGVK
jgi:dUTP pyrophosphatase